MKVLFIGGTGNISSESSKLAVERGMDVYLLNRGQRDARAPVGATVLNADINDEGAVAKLLEGQYFDAVVDFIAFTPAQIERDIRLFRERTAQYLFISSACIYRKPFAAWPVTESAMVANPLWPYAVDKIECEKRLLAEYHKNGFPFTIVRPSHTYSDTLIPVSLAGTQGAWAVATRMLQGKPVIVHGDGLTLWTITHSKDFAKGFVGLLGNDHALYETVHITTDEAVTWDSIYNSIGYALGVEPQLIHISTEMIAAFYPEYYGRMIGDSSNCAIFDNTKIKRLVPDFQATIRADEGVKSAVQYHLSHPELQKQDTDFDALCDRMVAAYNAFKTAGQ